MVGLDLDDASVVALEMWAVLEVADFELEKFAWRLGLDPTHPDTIGLYDVVHASYVEAWRREGDVFWEALRPIVARLRTHG